MNSKPTEFKGDEEGKLTSVTLEDGQTLPASVCVLGIGVVPSTGFLEESGVELNDYKTVVVNKVRISSSLSHDFHMCVLKSNPCITF